MTETQSQELPLGELDPLDPEIDDQATSPIDEATRRTIIVIVFAPRSIEPKRFRFKLDLTVGNAAEVTAVAFGYEPGTPTFQKKNGTVLDRTKTLHEADVHNREHLELVDAGGGV